MQQGGELVPSQAKTAKELRAERTENYKRIVKNLWRLVFTGIGIIVLWFGGLILFGDLPTFEQLENPVISDATQIIGSDAEVFGSFYIENRVRVRYEDLSPHLINALVATEDERYYKHPGIDRKALQRVVVRTMLFRQSSAGGGSTITQQLAKLLFKRKNLSGKSLPVRVWIMANTKFKEWITAVRLERRYTKEEIMTMYLNQFDFINGAYGIRSSSQTYFSTTQDSLKLEEAAMLVGMLKNPSLYNPRRFPERATKRREVVLKQMTKNELLTQAEYDSIRVLPLELKFRRADHNEGLAPFFREILREEAKDILADLKKPDGTKWNLYTDGLKIQTTIDTRMQAIAEEAAWEHLKSLQKTFFSHWKDRDPWTYGVTEGTSKWELRQQSFERLVRETDRFESLRGQTLKKSKALELRDIDILRMYEIEEKGWSLRDRWLDQGYINKDLSRKYMAIMGKDRKGEDWKEVKTEWKTLMKRVEEVFNTPYKMKVFAYNDAGETDTTMTPYDSLRYHRMILQIGSMAVDPHTGEIKAWVGGVNHKYFKFDHVNQTVQRQVGSTFKPFLYSTFVSNGYSPCYKVHDAPVTIEAGEGRFGLMRNWSPKNSGKFSYEYVTLMHGLRRSLNSVSATLIKELKTTEPLRNLVHKMGIDTSRVATGPAIVLGSADLSVYEMTGAYTTFANNGIYTKPYFIKEIKDRFGNTIYKAGVVQEQVLDEQSNYAMVQLLKGVVVGRPGFGGVKSEIGGKTGTTNSHADGWFMGITPNLVMGTWVGGDDRWIRFRTITYGQGARMAMPVFSKFLQKAEKDEDLNFDTKSRFHRPAFVDIEVDCTKYDTDVPDGVDFEEYDNDTTDETDFNEF